MKTYVGTKKAQRAGKGKRGAGVHDGINSVVRVGAAHDGEAVEGDEEGAKDSEEGERGRQGKAKRASELAANDMLL